MSYTSDFVDQSQGKAAGLQEINEGANIVYAAAGTSGLGATAWVLTSLEIID